MLSLRALDSAPTERDLQQLAQIQISCFEPPWSITQIQRQLNAPRGLNFALFDKEQLLGFVFYQLLFEEAEVLQIAIDPSYQQRGLAGRLLVDSLVQIKQRGSQRILLEVRPSNTAAIKLYQRLNFSLDGRRKNYYPSSGALNREDALLYSLNL